MSEGLSESLEDYVEAICHIEEEKRVARSKEIAARMRVNTSSVTGALKLLAEKGLVNYAPYDVVTLTEAGLAVARDVMRRHEVLREFFVDVLGVEPGEAESAACRMEHAMPDTILKKFIGFVRSARPGAGATAGRLAAEKTAAGGSPLAGTQEGVMVSLLSVSAGRELESRLASMGLIRGVKLRMVRNAGRGPLIVSVGGSRLMLGRRMAEKVLVR